MNMNDLMNVKKAKTRSICAENPTGAPGMGGRCPLEEGVAKSAARDLGIGWKVNPYIRIPAKTTWTLADIEGQGVINHIWLTPTGSWRDLIIRFYWDNCQQPSVECPVGDFFCMGWNKFSQINSLPVCVNPGSAFNCYWQMPFRKSCKITMENLSDETLSVYYQIDY